MATAPPPAPPAMPPEEPSNRWPWVALLLGVLIIGGAALFFFVSRGRSVDINIEGTPTANPVARAATTSPGPPPTLVPPSLPTSAPLPPTPTPVPSTATPVPSPTAPPKPTAPPPPTATAPAPPAAAPAAPAGVASPVPAQPGVPSSASPVPQPGAPGAASPVPPAPASPPTPVVQVANAGGFGNSRADLDSALGAPVGETPEHLVVYRKNNVEYHVLFAPDPSGRAALIVEQPQQSGQAFALDQAMASVRQVLPRDAQPPNPQAEGNERFVVERFTSQSLAAALPAEAFGAAAPGNFMAVYVRDAQQQARIVRIIVGPGDDPQALITAAGR